VTAWQFFDAHPHCFFALVICAALAIIGAAGARK
jgi:hypothetical protein